ncbi:MAG: porin family protein [Hyphomicrobiales bacterium]|nr:MAG: porin family protein [Hyphomicrobiales bacterium]
MKKIALSLAALAVTAGSALAADLPSRKGPAVLPPPPPPPPMWTGFYVGLNAGGAWANSNGQYLGMGPVGASAGWPHGGAALTDSYLAAFSAAGSAAGTNSGGNGGFIGGGQIGYNWQFYNNLVVGLEADIQGIAGNSGSRAFMTGASVADGSNYVGVHSVRGSLDYLGTVRGRLGWLFMPTMLVYGTGGLAYGGVTLNSTSMIYNDFFVNQLTAAGAPVLPVSVGGVNFSNTQVGWTAGGGLEWMFMPNWSAKVEYLYYDLGTVTQNFAMAATNNNTGLNAIFGGQTRARVNGNIVRAGVNYHFNWGSPAPIIAKY